MRPPALLGDVAVFRLRRQFARRRLCDEEALVLIAPFPVPLVGVAPRPYPRPDRRLQARLFTQLTARRVFERFAGFEPAARRDPPCLTVRRIDGAQQQDATLRIDEQDPRDRPCFARYQVKTGCFATSHADFGDVPVGFLVSGFLRRRTAFERVRAGTNW